MLTKFFLAAVLTAFGAFLLLMGSSGCGDTPSCNALGVLLGVVFVASAGVAVALAIAQAGRLAWQALSDERRHSARSTERAGEHGEDR